MRLGTMAEGPLERLALATGWVPTPLMDAYVGPVGARSLTVAVKLGVFEALEGGDRSALELASALACHPPAVERLLAALAGSGYVKGRGERYGLSRASRKWLLRSSPWSLYDFMLFLHDLWDDIGDLERAVRTGQSVDLHHRERPAEYWEHYMRGLAGAARLLGNQIVKRVPMATPPKRLLDVGGGHGMYSVSFCRKYLELQAEVLDLAPAAAQGRRIVEEQGFAERVRFREGDLRTTDWGEGYDLVLIFNVLHNSTPDEGRDALARAKRALRPGGTVAILEGEHRARTGPPSQLAGFGELFFFLVTGAQVYPEETMKEWARDAGFQELTTRRLFGMPSVVITGRA